MVSTDIDCHAIRMSASRMAARNRPSMAGSVKSLAPKCSMDQGSPVFVASDGKASRMALARSSGAHEE